MTDLENPEDSVGSGLRRLIGELKTAQDALNVRVSHLANRQIDDDRDMRTWVEELDLAMKGLDKRLNLLEIPGASTEPAVGSMLDQYNRNR